MKKELIIKNGIVYDPLNKVEGEIADIYIRDGKVVDSVGADAEVIDATGKAVTPGKIECHSHMVGPTPTAARMLTPEDIRSRLSPARGIRRGGGGRRTPTISEIGYEYAKLGFTRGFEGAVSPLYANQCCFEFNNLPIISKGIHLLMGNNWMILDYLKSKEQDKVTAYVSNLIKSSGAYSIKIVNPGGNEAYKWNNEWNCKHADDPVPHFGVTPRDIIKGLSIANEKLMLPHSIHLHVNNIGVPGNYEVTLDELDITKNIKVNSDSGRTTNTHITHAQFNSYGGDSWGTFESAADKVSKYINNSEHMTSDSGNVIFGDVTTMTADSSAEWALYKMTHNKLITNDVEAEDGVGILPFLYSKKSPVHASMWAIGLELQLLTDPWKMFITTDHPNGGVFLDYPYIYHWLMSEKARMDVAENVHPWAIKRTGLGGIDKEYDFNELIISTVAGPAIAMGVSKTEGHLGVGAEANVIVWDVNPLEFDFSKDPTAKEKLSEMLYTIKKGKIVVKDKEIVDITNEKIDYATPLSLDKELEKLVDIETSIKFKKYYTIQNQNFSIDPAWYLSQDDRIDVITGKLHAIPKEMKVEQ
ncbi:MAG: formylmethanofuran dehydrogenase subunit A [Methanosarcinaceae archaeon]|nr:formylmethanofuran dehydrogenase subunit A [Methanosarcinaceae archaeon]NKQ39404.1 formylmethanofuran dehydrogenase subunit A [Methanosarcinales archaeon]